MAFRLRKDTREWFKAIEPGLDLDFDMFYFCLMAGLAASRKAFSNSCGNHGTCRSFSGRVPLRGRVIVALFLARELDSLGIRFEERAVLHQEISKPRSTVSVASKLRRDGGTQPVLCTVDSNCCKSGSTRSRDISRHSCPNSVGSFHRLSVINRSSRYGVVLE